MDCFILKFVKIKFRRVGKYKRMKHYKIVLLKGDGIGPEIVDEAVKVLDKAALEFNFSVTYDYADLGGVAIDRTGRYN